MATSVYHNIIYQKNPPIAYITFNRPEKVNALSEDLQAEVRDALEDAGWRDDAIRVIIIKGAGHNFSAGFDLSSSGATAFSRAKASAPPAGGMPSGEIPNR